MGTIERLFQEELDLEINRIDPSDNLTQACRNKCVSQGRSYYGESQRRCWQNVSGERAEPTKVSNFGHIIYGV